MRRPRVRNWRVLIGVGTIVALAFVFRGSLARAFAVVQRPLVAAGTWVSARSYGWADGEAVSPARVAELEAARAAAAIDYAAYAELRTAYEELRTLNAFATRSHSKSVYASVVSRSVGPDASAFIIDRGSSDGIGVGDPAVSGDGLLVGKVIAVTPGSSTVRVITDRDSATGVTLLNGTRTIGVAEGKSGSLLALHYIPQDERVSVNDIVVTSGLEPSVPSGLVVGIVNSVSTVATEPFQQAVLEPLADARRLHTVLVIVSEAL